MDVTMIRPSQQYDRSCTIVVNIMVRFRHPESLVVDPMDNLLVHVSGLVIQWLQNLSVNLPPKLCVSKRPIVSHIRRRAQKHDISTDVYVRMTASPRTRQYVFQICKITLFCGAHVSKSTRRPFQTGIMYGCLLMFWRASILRINAARTTHDGHFYAPNRD